MLLTPPITTANTHGVTLPKKKRKIKKKKFLLFVTWSCVEEVNKAPLRGKKIVRGGLKNTFSQLLSAIGLPGKPGNERVIFISFYSSAFDYILRDPLKNSLLLECVCAVWLHWLELLECLPAWCEVVCLVPSGEWGRQLIVTLALLLCCRRLDHE